MTLGLCHLANGQFKVIGYAASWSQTNIQYSKLTHINYAFALPQYGGHLKPIDNPGYLQTIVSNAHANGVKVFVAIGGWSDAGSPLDPVFESIGGDPASRTNLVNDALNLVSSYNLDGVDVDWEYPDAGASANNYNALISQLSSALRARGKGLSIAVAADSYNSGGITSAVFQYVDHVNIMAYDDGSSANHSTYQFAVNALNMYKSKGCPANKCIVGVPFYARPSWRSFSQLLAAGADPYADFFGSDGYNGINTIKQKTTMALSNAGGIMIWELSQDATGTYSLLSAINDVVKSSNNNNNTGSGVATFYKDCNYGGYAVGLPVGSYNMSDLNARGILNDDISSLQVNAGYEVQLFWDINFSGSSTVISGSNSCLVGIGWNDQATSLIVRASTSSSSQVIQAESFGAMAGVQTESTTDAGGGLDVGWIDAGDWMAFYNINFPTSGSYTVEYRVASLSGGGTLSCDLNAGSIQLGAIAVPSTGGWQNWTTITQTINVNAGTYNFGIFAQAGGWNLNWFRITKVGSAKYASSSIAEADVYENGLELFPNPVINEINLKSGNDLSGGNVRIINMLGTEVMNVNSTSVIDVSSLESGMYTLIYSKDGNKMVKKFVK
jgi:hypothetical protein